MPTRCRNETCRAFTLIEAVLASMVLGILITAVLTTASAAVKSTARSSQRATASMLADELLADITRRNYADETNAATLGIDAGEPSTKRSGLDDVDDFDRWTEDPPANADGSRMNIPGPWSRAVSVKWVASSDMATVSGTDTGVKLITVHVFYDRVKVLSRSALRTGQPTSGSASVTLPIGLDVKFTLGGAVIDLGGK